MIEQLSENYIALLISIFRNVPPEDAFTMLDPEKGRHRRKLTEKDYDDMKAMRESGMSWAEMGPRYKRTSASLRKMYAQHNKEVLK